MSKLLLAVFIFVLCFGAAGAAEKESLPLNIRTETVTLDNGLTVVITPMPSQSTVSLYGLVKVGSAMEGEYLGAGITHFVEHMLFKGTPRRGVGQISREVQALGGTINASTSFDYTIFLLTVPSDKFVEGLDILVDMLMNPAFDSEETEKEKTVITKEIRLHNDRPQRYLSEQVFATVFQRHPYRVPIIGYEDVFLTLGHDDLKRFHAKYYVPNNIVLSIAGDVVPSRARAEVDAAFGKYPRQREVVRLLPPEPEQIARRQREIRFPTELVRVSMSYPGVSIRDRDMVALDVLSMVLGSGKSSRLYQDLVSDRRLAQSVQAGNYTPHDKGVFEIECVLNADRSDEVIPAIEKHVERIKTRGVTAAELAKARRRVLTQYVLEHQTSGDVAYQTAMDAAFTGDAEFSQTYLRAVRDVTVDDIRRVANKYLINPALSVVLMLPDKEALSPTAVVEAPAEADFETVRLDNGLTLVFKPNRAVPWISLVAALKGGVAQEDPDLNGVAALTARTWNKGTRSRTAKEIAREAEGRGISLGGFSTADSFGLSLQCLPDESETALDFFMDVLQNPVFSADEIDKEKGKMRADILKRRDSVFQFSFTTLRSSLFPDHPFGRTDLGTLATLDRLGRQQVLDYYRKYVAADNLVVAVIGDFSETFKQDLKKRLARIKPHQVPLSTAKVAPVEGPKEERLQMDKRQALVLFGYQAVPYAHPDRYGIETLAALLGSTFHGRIFQRVREEFGQSYTLGGAYYPGRQAGLMFFYVMTTPEYVPKIRERMTRIIASVKEEPFSDQELKDMQAYLIGRHQRGLQTYAAMAFRTALDALHGLDAEYYREYTDGIRAVTLEDIRRLAETYLDPDRAVVLVTNPPADEDAVPAPEDTAEPVGKKAGREAGRDASRVADGTDRFAHLDVYTSVK